MDKKPLWNFWIPTDFIFVSLIVNKSSWWYEKVEAGSYRIRDARCEENKRYTKREQKSPNTCEPAISLYFILLKNISLTDLARRSTTSFANLLI